jgi:hypothetical protein
MLVHPGPRAEIRPRVDQPREHRVRLPKKLTRVGIGNCGSLAGRRVVHAQVCSNRSLSTISTTSATVSSRAQSRWSSTASATQLIGRPPAWTARHTAGVGHLEWRADRVWLHEDSAGRVHVHRRRADERERMTEGEGEVRRPLPCIPRSSCRRRRLSGRRRRSLRRSCCRGKCRRASRGRLPRPHRPRTRGYPAPAPPSCSATFPRWPWLMPETASGIGSCRIPDDASAEVAAPEATSRCRSCAGRATFAAGRGVATGRVRSAFMSAAGVTPAIFDGPNDSP